MRQDQIRLPSRGPCSVSVRISGPSSVMRSVCSHWADNPPSRVRTVHPSASGRLVCHVPVLIIGSIVKHVPGWITVRLGGREGT